MFYRRSYPFGALSVVQGGPSDVNACTSAVNDTRAALANLGYGKLQMGVPWGNADMAALKAYRQYKGLPGGMGFPNKNDLDAMEADLQAGAKPGPQPVPALQKVGNTYVTPPAGSEAAPGSEGEGEAGKYLVVGAIVLAAIGGLYLVTRKGKSGSTATAAA